MLKDEQEFTRLGMKGGGEDIPDRGNRYTKAGGPFTQMEELPMAGPQRGRTQQHAMRLGRQNQIRPSGPNT